MNGELNIPADAIVKLADAQQDIALTSQANATPLPGALREAFSIIPEITVGKYKVRPFVDRDFEFLQAMEHPLHKHINGVDSTAEMVRGQYAWEMCFLFTHPFKEVKALIKEKGVSGLKEAATEEFEEFSLRDILELSKAIFQQLEIFWSPVIAYKTPDDSNGSKKNTLVDGMVQQSMDSVG